MRNAHFQCRAGRGSLGWNESPGVTGRNGGGLALRGSGTARLACGDSPPRPACALQQNTTEHQAAKKCPDCLRQQGLPDLFSRPPSRCLPDKAGRVGRATACHGAASAGTRLTGEARESDQRRPAQQSPRFWPAESGIYAPQPWLSGRCPALALTNMARDNSTTAGLYMDRNPGPQCCWAPGVFRFSVIAPRHPSRPRTRQPPRITACQPRPPKMRPPLTRPLSPPPGLAPHTSRWLV